MSNVCQSEKLSLVKNKFLCCVPVPEIGLREVLRGISWSDQEYLVAQTVNNYLLKNFPIKLSYQRAFLKRVIDILEKNCDEVHDSLYDSYCAILSLEGDEKFCYKHYCIDDSVITLKENKSYISEGTTGLCSWQASLVLSQWCLNNREYLRNKSVLELGSGVGLVGVNLILHCQPKAVYLTDCHPKVLAVLSENVSLNISDSKKTESLKSKKGGSEKTTQEIIQLHKLAESASSFSKEEENLASENLANLNSGEKCQLESKSDSVYHVKKSKVDSCEVVNNRGKFETGKSSAAETVTETAQSAAGTFRARSGRSASSLATRGKFESSESQIITPNFCGANQATEKTLSARTDLSIGEISETQLVNCVIEDSEVESCDRDRVTDNSNVWLETAKNKTVVSVLNLAWESIAENKSVALIRPDVILAADVVYDNSVFVPLCGAVKYFLDLNSDCEVLFACTERNPATLAEFLNLLKKNKFAIQELPSPIPQHFFWSSEVPIRLFRVRCH